MPGYSCSIKERMLYSSCKSRLLEEVEKDYHLEITRKVNEWRNTWNSPVHTGHNLQSNNNKSHNKDLFLMLSHSSVNLLVSTCSWRLKMVMNWQGSSCTMRSIPSSMPINRLLLSPKVQRVNGDTSALSRGQGTPYRTARNRHFLSWVYSSSCLSLCTDHSKDLMNGKNVFVNFLWYVYVSVHHK